jgi:hypothetical protein
MANYPIVDAYKRVIDPGDHTHSAGVRVHRAYGDELIQLIVGIEEYPSKTSYLTIKEAEEMIEALQEAIALLRAVESLDPPF